MDIGKHLASRNHETEGIPRQTALPAALSRER
jgi:hypothetical protein